MGTRGAVGFYHDGENKIMYNHFDSYPSELGVDILNFLRATAIDELNKMFDNIKMIRCGEKPTPEQIEHCKQMGVVDLDVGEQSEEDWYCLLRRAQGNLKVYKDGLIYMEDNHLFICDSLFCEWAYVINLDENLLEVYVGFNHSSEPQEGNRYWEEFVNKREETDLESYYPCTLFCTFPFDNLPDEKEFLNKIKQADKLLHSYRYVEEEGGSAV